MELCRALLSNEKKKHVGCKMWGVEKFSSRDARDGYMPHHARATKGVDISGYTYIFLVDRSSQPKLVRYHWIVTVVFTIRLPAGVMFVGLVPTHI